MLNPAAAPSCRESAQLACTHRIDESLVQICSSVFDNLADHPWPPPIKLSPNESRFGLSILRLGRDCIARLITLEIKYRGEG